MKKELRTYEVGNICGVHSQEIYRLFKEKRFNGRYERSGKRNTILITVDELFSETVEEILERKRKAKKRKEKRKKREDNSPYYSYKWAVGNTIFEAANAKQRY